MPGLECCDGVLKYCLGVVVTVSALEAHIFVKSCERFEVEASKSKSGYLMDARSRD